MGLVRYSIWVLVFLFSATSISGMADGLVPIKEVFEPAGTFDPAKFGKVAVVQWNNSQASPVGVSAEDAESFKQSNRETLAKYIEEAAAKGAVWILTPEFATVGYPYHPNLKPEEDNFLNREEVKPYVEPVGGNTTKFFAKLAKRLKVTIQVGMAEVDPETDRYYNTVIVLNDEGKVVATYRKIHLYQVETKFLDAGSKPVTYQGPFGKVGIAICSDIYSGHPMDTYLSAKVKAVALSTSWAQWNSGMSSFQRGAQWVKGYVLAANQTYFPDSGVVNPDGTKQSHIRQTTGIAYGYLPYKEKLKD
jgi:predicted amidohydrolase